MKNYLVIQLARFGDLIQTKRLLGTLAARPESTVHLCLDASLAPLARLVYPYAVLYPITAHGTGLSGEEATLKMLLNNRRVFAELAEMDFETVYNLNFSGLNFRLAALFDPMRVEGYAWHNGQEITGRWPSMAMRWSGFRRLSMNLVDFWGAYCPDMLPAPKVNPDATPKGGGIGVVLAGRESRRSLPAPLLAQITATLAGSRKARSIKLLGGKAEHAAGQTVIKELPANLQSMTENLAGKTDWQRLVEIVGALDLLITPDTGTMHLAAHLGTPVAAFFLSSAWCFETGPYGLGHTVYQGVTECLPCLETAPCRENLKCLNGFADQGFRRFLVTGKAEHAPKGILALHSAFDDLGQTYAPFVGTDADAPRRSVLRDFLLHHLTGAEPRFDRLEQAFAEQLYREKDWMTVEKPAGTQE
ncbi:glycosyltransferase family 9 protein [uncultured Pseudodesulfovibrio sp.]|uniref:glycosyltransferase family 9 protein n=1 Tax=uncultured Pseudodesulfovibrio sp. TaxID=2035858 RepID=UPI0029C6D5D0|nr:glycosyltransferase family 9 protein [uncultured Pseudodesulfovibrio sp.]